MEGCGALALAQTHSASSSNTKNFFFVAEELLLQPVCISIRHGRVIGADFSNENMPPQNRIFHDCI